MLQYLLNSTAIWLISLIVFDLLLRKESFHSYNRYYLLFTFVLGSVFPLISWQGGNSFYPSRLEQPIERIIRAKRTVIESSAATAAIDWEQWVSIAYLIGVLAGMGMLISEIMKLVNYTRSGKRHKEDGWHIIETGREHAPFSFLNTLYVASKELYSNEEWKIILAHEKRHHTLLHFFDAVLMQSGRILFWFHPLVYVYNSRLLLVHEYQADASSAVQPQQYGRFLVEQALLQSAPSISHSFNRSPIKKRILMLTHRSSSIAKAKMLACIPLVLLCIFCFSKTIFSQKFERKGNIVTYRGNTFTYEEVPEPDTVVMQDPVTGKETVKIIRHDAVPIKMNGEKIYVPTELSSQPTTYTQNGTIPDYVYRNISPTLNKLPDGTYRLDINNIIVDKTGKVVFYEGIGLSHPSDMDALKMNDEIQSKIDEIINKIPRLKPGRAGDKNVAVKLELFFYAYEVEVKNHQSSVRQIWQ